MLNDNSSGVSGYITQGCLPPQHVDALRFWLVVLLTVFSGCQLTAGGSSCPTQPSSALPPMSNAVSISNFWVLETLLSPNCNACLNTLTLTHFATKFRGKMPIYCDCDCLRTFLCLNSYFACCKNMLIVIKSLLLWSVDF